MVEVCMNNGIRFICFGDSIENLRLSCEYNVIGVPKRVNFQENEEVYMVVKVKNIWYVCNKANVQRETDMNPYEEYYTYAIDNIVACKPFGINMKCREYLGIYWGMIFQRPRIISNEDFCSFVIRNFCEISIGEMFQKLESLCD